MKTIRTNVEMALERCVDLGIEVVFYGKAPTEGAPGIKLTNRHICIDLRWSYKKILYNLNKAIWDAERVRLPNNKLQIETEYHKLLKIKQSYQTPNQSEHHIDGAKENSDVADIGYSKLYHLMIYFAHSTLVIYDKDIKSKRDMTVKEFRHKNKITIQRVFDEGLAVMNYELSHNQLDAACMMYLISKHAPKSAKETAIYTV